MYDELVKRLRCQLYGNCPACVNWYTEEVEPNLWRERCVAIDAADAIEELQKAVLRLEEESGILDELPIVDQSMPCDTCAHKGNVDFDYCHICNNEADMYKPKPPREEQT